MPNNASKRRDDVLNLSLGREDAVSVDLGAGYDIVAVSARDAVRQVRLTFTSAEVGNGSANDAGTGTNQDGGLAVRLQVEGSSGEPVGAENRFDDEGISFVSDGTFTFDVRDLVSGTARGDQFAVARLGTAGRDFYNEGTSKLATYINAGGGDDRVLGGLKADFLVGGAGADYLAGGRGVGADSFIGGAGNDTIRGGAGNDTAIVNISTDGADNIDLSLGNDQVNVSAATGTTQVRLTFTSAEVGNGSASDSNTLANQDGGLAVRVQAEDILGNLTGTVTRTDDEGMRFVAAAGVTFDVRDLVSGTARGDTFTVVQLGTKMGQVIYRAGTDEVAYVNAGAGNDRVVGGSGDDFLVGGIGNDRLNGGLGSDTLLGGSGNDLFVFRQDTGTETIADFLSGTDRIDLRALDVRFADVTATTTGTTTVLAIDTNNDDVGDLTITLQNVANAPVVGDYLF